MSENRNDPLTAEEMVQADERFCGPRGSVIHMGYAKDLGLPDTPTLHGDPKKIAAENKALAELARRNANINGNK